MSENEEFLEEGEFALAEHSGSNIIGSKGIVPDETILGDLKDLANLTFGTRWSQSESSPRSDRSFQGRRPMQNRNNLSDRNNLRDRNNFDRPRPETPREFQAPRQFREPRDPNSPRPREGNRERRPARFDDRGRENRAIPPPFEVQFYQEDTSFNLLLDEMRKNCKTYELFVVARLILQKPERFVAAVRRRPNQEGVRLPLFLSLLDDLVFSTEHEAMTYIIQHHIEEFFDVVDEAVEPPKGRFTCVHRCGVTKKLLSAPNYHKYRTILRAHFDAEIHSMPFERFIAKIETTKEESDIQSWIQQMSHKITYTPKMIDETVTDLEPRDSLDGVKNYLLQHFKDRILRSVTTIRVAGVAIESLPSRAISHAIKFFLQRQREFPFDTASNLRFRFRRAGFGIYRKGKKGFIHICAVRRKFREESDIFEANVQALIDFLESHETITLPLIQRDYIEGNHLQEKDVLGGLDWLIREGYVVNYDNGTLLLNPKLKSSPSSHKPDEFIDPKRSIIQLEKIETAIEKVSDGTLSISQTTTLATPEDNLGIGDSFPGNNSSDETLSISQTTTLATPDDNLGIGDTFPRNNNSDGSKIGLTNREIGQ
jgi:hypothetical protein